MRACAPGFFAGMLRGGNVNAAIWGRSAASRLGMNACTVLAASSCPPFSFGDKKILEISSNVFVGPELKLFNYFCTHLRHTSRVYRPTHSLSTDSGFERKWKLHLWAPNDHMSLSLSKPNVSARHLPCCRLRPPPAPLLLPPSPRAKLTPFIFVTACFFPRV